MFEFEVKDLKEGDVFTFDNGETWHTFEAAHWMGPEWIVYTADQAIPMNPRELVIVQ